MGNPAKTTQNQALAEAQAQEQGKLESGKRGTDEEDNGAHPPAVSAPTPLQVFNSSTAVKRKVSHGAERRVAPSRVAPWQGQGQL